MLHHPLSVALAPRPVPRIVAPGGPTGDGYRRSDSRSTVDISSLRKCLKWTTPAGALVDITVPFGCPYLDSSPLPGSHVLRRRESRSGAHVRKPAKTSTPTRPLAASQTRRASERTPAFSRLRSLTHSRPNLRKTTSSQDRPAKTRSHLPRLLRLCCQAIARPSARILIIADGPEMPRV